MVHKNKQKVFWSDEEIDRVAQAAVDFSFIDKEFIRQFCTKAQKSVLPPERQRKVLTSTATNEKLEKRFIQLRQKALEPKPSQEQEEPAVITIEKEVVLELPREQVLASITNEEFVCEVARRMAPVLSSLGEISKLVQVLNRERVASAAVQESVIRVRPDSFTSKPRKVKVLLFGFLPQQEHDIKEKVSGFNLELVTCKKGEVPPSAGYCVMMRKISHPAWQKIRDGIGNDRVYLVEGITEALKKLADINSLIGTGVR